MRSVLKKVAFTLIAIFVPLISLGLASELVLRVMEPPLLTNTGEIVRASADPDKQYELIPAASGTLAGAAVTINSFGCRDREYPLARTPGVVRIVGVGDSLTFGQGVGADETYLSRLESELAAKHLPAEVINCGVFGYNVREESARFSEVVDLLKPDIVLIGYELGDLLPNPPYRRKTGAGEGESAKSGGGIAGMRWRGLFEPLKRSRLVTFLAYRYSFLLKKLSLRNWDALYADGSPLWADLSARYARMAGLAHARGIDIAVAIVPELSNLDAHYPFRSVHERVARMCRERGIAVIDLLPSFLGQNGPSLWVHPQDRHPNARGHAIIASALDEPVALMVQAHAAAGSAERPPALPAAPSAH